MPRGRAADGTVRRDRGKIDHTEGVFCPQCRCGLLFACWSRRAGTQTIRRRMCKRCQHEVVTSETIIIKTAAPRKKGNFVKAGWRFDPATGDYTLPPRKLGG